MINHGNKLISKCLGIAGTEKEIETAGADEHFELNDREENLLLNHFTGRAKMAEKLIPGNLKKLKQHQDGMKFVFTSDAQINHTLALQHVKKQEGTVEVRPLGSGKFEFHSLNGEGARGRLPVDEKIEGTDVHYISKTWIPYAIEFVNFSGTMRLQYKPPAYEGKVISFKKFRSLHAD